MSQIQWPEVNVCSRIVGTGWCVPDKVITNEHFSAYLDTNDEWITSRTGIKERRFAEPGTGVSEVAEPAARQALKAAGLEPKDLDAIVFGTVTPDYVFPNASCMLQKRLGAKQALAFDVSAVCSGFIYAITVGDSLIAGGQAKNVLVVGGDVFHHLIDQNDRSTAVIFADGAGAVVLTATGEPKNPAGRYVRGSSKDMRGIYGSELHTWGEIGEMLFCPMGTAKPVSAESMARGDHWITMQGRETFKIATRSLAEVTRSLLNRVGIPIEAVDFFLSHQANKRILDTMAEMLAIPPEKVLANIQRYGNTSAGTVPILLGEYVDKGVIKPGNLLLLSAFGGGVTWGATLVRF